MSLARLALIGLALLTAVAVGGCGSSSSDPAAADPGGTNGASGPAASTSGPPPMNPSMNTEGKTPPPR